MKSTIILVDGIAERARPLGFFERPRLSCRSIRGSPAVFGDEMSVHTGR